MVWRDHNLRHVTQDHAERSVTQEDVEDVLADEGRQEEADTSHGTIVAEGYNRDRVPFVVPLWSCRMALPFRFTPVAARSKGRRNEA